MPDGPRPIDRLVAGYAALTGVILLVPQRPSSWPLLAAAHLALVLIPLRWRPLRRPLGAVRERFPRPARVLADWYPLLILPLLYAELAPLIMALHGGAFFDGTVMAWEESLFGGQPSATLAYRIHSLPVSEVLHAGYLSYYPLIYLPPLFLYLRGRREAFADMLFAIMLTFLVHYVVFLAFPVQGPRYVFPAPNGELAAGPVYRLTHGVLEAGSSRGAAFPSSHVAVAVAQTVSAWRHMRGALPLVLVATVLLALGAVYGGFHYAVDALAGAAAGLVLVLWAPRLRRVLGW